MLREFSDRVPELPTRRPLLCSWQFWAGVAFGLVILGVGCSYFRLMRNAPCFFRLSEA